MYVAPKINYWEEQELFGIYVEDMAYDCAHPGKNGCGFCDACLEIEVRHRPHRHSEER